MGNNDKSVVVVRSADEMAGESLLGVAEYIAALDNQTREVARQRAAYILNGDAAPSKCRELLAQLSTFCDRMATRREWAAMSIIDRALSLVNEWEESLLAVEVCADSLRAAETSRPLDECPDYQAAVNAANALKLDVHSHLFHLGSRLPATVRDNPRMTGVLRALKAIATSVRYAPVDYVPSGNGSESGQAALARIAAAETEAAKRRQMSLDRRAQRLLENARAIDADKQAAESSK